MSNLFLNPVVVIKRNPAIVCMQTGTFAILPAIIDSNPALGVCECTICGFSFLKILYNLKSETMSLNGVIALVIGTITWGQPSFSITACRSLPSALTIITSQPCCFINFNWPANNVRNASGTVVTRISLAMLQVTFFMPHIQYKKCPDHLGSFFISNRNFSLPEFF